jgi:hypothetical protein
MCSLIFGLLQIGIDMSAAFFGSLAFTLWLSGHLCTNALMSEVMPGQY